MIYAKITQLIGEVLVVWGDLFTFGRLVQQKTPRITAGGCKLNLCDMKYYRAPTGTTLAYEVRGRCLVFE